ncbi:MULTISPECIES: glutaredoxin 3 [Neptuniibacter]|jgi:glutaredoxin 3|uniref:glutaredoxin 3 n=1 Tax=Neptuniibacter TaxID=459520 RepID=UPI000833DAB4|nr:MULTISPECIES: glutaredoxin 3 [Neptuniibacter]MDO6515473.1 glutaredoxin 3 [Neptuniibacter sp. 2_MG-2023]MDO6595125.1 glutaredoxin 3 [Neptuniibacter sp. 1_MG-2023]
MKDVTIYTTKWCPFCIRAKKLLEHKEINYTEIKVDGDQAKRQEMTELSGGRTVPQIFIGDTPIGGCDEIFALERQGKLDALINAN